MRSSRDITYVAVPRADGIRNRVGDDKIDKFDFCPLCGTRVRHGSCPVHGKATGHAPEMEDET